jgi:DNA polymerase III alpha subunit
LIRVGALRFSGKNKKELLWEANFLHKRVNKVAASSTALFQERPMVFKLPQLHHSRFEDAMDEIELLGFPLCDVFTLVDADVSKYVTARQLPQYVGSQVELLCYYITQKPVRTVKGQLMFFGTFIDKNGDWVDSVHFPDKAEKQRLTGKGFYHLKGKVMEEFGVYSVEVSWMQKVGLKQQ